MHVDVQLAVSVSRPYNNFPSNCINVRVGGHMYVCVYSQISVLLSL